MKKIVIILLIVLTWDSYSQETTFPFLDIKSMGAYEFIKSNPECDGRNVVVFILDNSVDPSIPGMINTSEGKAKVIDMQDFSNQLAFDLKEATIEKNGTVSLLKVGDNKIFGYDHLSYKPFDGKYYYGLIDENINFKNSTVKDLNSNGKVDDKFSIIAFKIKITDDIISKFRGLIKPKVGSEQWVYYVDEDNDNNIDEESPKFNYKFNLDYFNFFSGDKGKRPLVVMSANIAPNSQKMVINTCDGSHGTHCGGIACGYEIYNSKGNNGVAPGAYIVSLKIGSNLLSGGATTTESMKKAYEYGIEFLKESGIKYGVYSMSYGIGSEIPGRSEIEKYLNSFALKHENIVVVTSNGNNGPGINSTGNPAGANNIISAGAMLPVDVLKNLYGSLRNKPWITNFSSRGGESGKPDVVSPGGASSSVPAFERGDAFWGTSMACPQVAGAAAVLFSAAEHYKLEVNGSMIKKAIKYGATPLAGYLNIDQGMGLVNIKNSFEYLKALSERREFEKVADYKIETTNTFFDDKKGTVAFWKSSGYFPGSNEKQHVSITPLFYDKLAAETKHNFYRAYTLSSDSPWLKSDKDEIYLRGELGGSFSMVYDSSKITKPGIYSGRILAKAKGEPGSKFGDFDVQANIIIPYKFTSANNYSLKLKGEKLEIGDIKRIFIEVPAGASSALINISPVEGKNFALITYLYNPEGRSSDVGASNDANLRKDIDISISHEKMMNGIWELIPSSNYQSLGDSYFDLSVQFFLFQSDNSVITEFKFPLGEKPSSEFKLINLGNNLVNAALSGSLSGYKKSNDVTNIGSSVYNKNFTVGSDISKCEFYVEMNADDFNKATDISFNIFDESDKSIFSEGLSRKSEKFSFAPPKPGKYRIEIEMGYTHNEFEQKEWKFELVEKYFYANPNVLILNSKELKCYPGTWNTINFSASSAVLQAPDSYSTFGFVQVKDLISGKNIFIQDIELKEK